jgi:transposase
LTGGEAHDCPVAERLIRRVKPSKRMLGDKAYDSAELRAELDERGTTPVIPNRSNRKQPFSFSKRLYKLRWRIESAFNRLKDFRRIATRYDRLARNYLASVCLVAALVAGFGPPSDKRLWVVSRPAACCIALRKSDVRFAPKLPAAA